MLQNNRELTTSYVRILNCWLGYNFLLIIMSSLPHWPVPLLSWVNCSLYFLSALAAFKILRAGAFNKEIYFNIFITFLFFSVGIFSILIGKDYCFGNNYVGWYVHVYRKIIIAFLLSFTVIYIALKKIWSGKSIILNYGLAAIVTVPFFLLLFRNILLDKNFIFSNYNLLYQNLFLFKMLPFLFICLYGFISLKNDRPMGEYTNSIMVVFFFIFGQELLSHYPAFRKIIVLPIDQIILTISLILLLAVLLRKLTYNLSDTGKFYDALLQGEHKELKPLIEPQGKRNLLAFRIVLCYFEYRRNLFLFIALLFALGINILNPPLFLKMNIFVISLCLLVIVLYFSHLYSRRFER